MVNTSTVFLYKNIGYGLTFSEIHGICDIIRMDLLLSMMSKSTILYTIGYFNLAFTFHVSIHNFRIVIMRYFIYIWGHIIAGIKSSFNDSFKSGRS